MAQADPSVVRLGMRLPLMITLVALLAACTPAGQQAAPDHKATLAVSVNPLTVPAWWIDPSNSTGCASDTNAAIQATCGGPNIGPLRTWAGLATQLCGPYVNASTCMPRLRQTVTVTFLSSHTDNTDPVYLKAYLEAGAQFILQGSLTQVAQGTTGTVTAKNRATPQLLASTFVLTAPDGGAAPTLTAGMLVVNNTHASRAWLYVPGSPNKLSTPMTPQVPATANSNYPPTDVSASWANGDSVSIFLPTSINLAEVDTRVVDYNGAFANLATVYQANLFDPALLDPLYVGGSGHVNFLEDSIQRVVQMAAMPARALSGLAVNCSFAAGIETFQPTTNPLSQTFTVSGGQFLSSANFQMMQGAFLDGDVILGNGALNQAIVGGYLGTVYVETSNVLTVLSTTKMQSQFNAQVPVLWGPGAVNVAGNARLFYPAGAAKAAATFVQTGAFQINGGTKYLTLNTASATGIVTGNTTLSAANLDTSFGATPGCALGNGATICNNGP